MKRAFPFVLLSFAFAVCGGAFAAPSQGVTKKQLERTVTAINSNMAEMVTAEIGRNVDGYIDQIARESAVAATNYLPSLVEGMKNFASLDQFLIEDFTTNSMTFSIHSLSNGIFVTERHSAYFSAEWIMPTNHGFKVISSNLPEIPEGTLFALDAKPVSEGSHAMSDLSQSGSFWWAVYEIHNASLFSKPLNLVWAEERYASGSIVTNRVICESGLYGVGVSTNTPGAYSHYSMSLVQNPGTAPHWASNPSWDSAGNTFHVLSLTDRGTFRVAVLDDIAPPESGEDDMFQGRIAGTFTLAPIALTDAQNAAARTPSAKVSVFRRVMDGIRSLFAPDALAAGSLDVFANAAGLPIFRVAWKTDRGDVLGTYDFPVSKEPGKTKVDDMGDIYDGPENFDPYPWYPLRQWCMIENWMTFPVAMEVLYATANGSRVTEGGIRYASSWRSLHVAQFKNLFIGYQDGLYGCYTYPRKVSEVDLCESGKHAYIHCKCAICGKVRDHHYEKDASGCAKCVREEGNVFISKDGEISADFDSTTICGHVPDGEEYHGGWRMVGRQVAENGTLEFCGCACGHYSAETGLYYPPQYQGIRGNVGLVRKTLGHDWNELDPDAAWSPGDENGENEEHWHHAEIPCRRNCAAVQAVSQGHEFYNDDGTIHDVSVEYQDEDYHTVRGTCRKCQHPMEAGDMHLRTLPDSLEAGEVGTCVCVGSVRMNTPGCGQIVHKYVWTVCGELRCLYCLELSEDSPKLGKSDHRGVLDYNATSGARMLMADSETEYGYVLRAPAPDEAGHWCGCGLYQLGHNFVEDRDANRKVCVDNGAHPWWRRIGCGYSEPLEEEKSEFEATVDLEYDPNDPYNLRLTMGGSSFFSWHPRRGEQGPTPEDLWPDENNPPPVPPIPDIGDTAASGGEPVTLSARYEWKASEWQLKRGMSWWEKLRWWLQNTPIIFTP